MRRLDYLSQMLGSSRQGSVWLDLSSSSDSSYQRSRQMALAELIHRILTIPAETRALCVLSRIRPED